MLFLCLIPIYLNAEELPIVTAEFPPFKYEKSGQIVGSDTEIIEQVFNRIGYAAKITVMPFKRAYCCFAI